jgi:AAA+ ATPase superfamily predicted ATPase
MASMIKTTKITDEELIEVKQLQQDFQVLTYQIGELSVIEHNLQNQIDNIKIELKNFYSSLKTLQDKEKDLIDKLNQTYPDVNINFETGEIS